MKPRHAAQIRAGIHLAQRHGWAALQLPSIGSEMAVGSLVLAAYVRTMSGGARHAHVGN